MATKITRIDHIDMIVKDVAASVAFYEAVGFTRMESDYAGSGVQLRFPGPGVQPILELCPEMSLKGVMRPLGLSHIAVAVESLDEARGELAKVGIDFDGEPRLIEATGRRLTNIIDPDGRKLQFVETE